VKQKLRDLGYAGLGLGETVREKVQSLVKKGKKSGKKLPRRGDLEEKVRSGVAFAGKEALIISKKSLEMLERELKKLEREAHKARIPKAAKKARKKKKR